MGRLTVSGAVQHYLNKTKAIGKPIMEFHARHIMATLGEVPAEAVDQDAVDRYVAKRTAAPGTVRKELGILRAALRFCGKTKMISHAPQFSLPTAPAPRDRRLTGAEFDALLSACKSHHLTVFCQLAWHTAARASAILDLKWSDVDLKARRINYTAAGRQKRRVTVPVNDTLMPVLQEALKGAMTPFVVEYAGKPVGSIKKAFATACGQAGLVDVSPHVLRHSAACAMIEAGVTFAEVAQFLGHSSPSVTFNVYARYSPEYLANAAKALER